MVSSKGKLKEVKMLTRIEVVDLLLKYVDKLEEKYNVNINFNIEGITQK